LVRGQSDQLATEIARLNVQKEALLAEITRLCAGRAAQMKTFVRTTSAVAR
jgi:hypothetical protein